MWLEGEVRGDRTQSQEPRIDSLVANDVGQHDRKHLFNAGIYRCQQYCLPS